jgi:hypothetical protein
MGDTGCSDARSQIESADAKAEATIASVRPCGRRPVDTPSNGDGVQILELNHTYEGPYAVVGQTSEGLPMFESSQKLDVGVLGENLNPVLEINSVRWTVDGEGHIAGNAQFVAVDTYDFITATLDGRTPEPPEGQDYRDAFVTVTFTGGSRHWRNASGTATVEAKLFNNGISRGTITGAVNLNAN